MTLLFAFLLGCSGGDTPAADAPTAGVAAPPIAIPTQVARALELARALDADPSNPDAALAAVGATAAELDGLMYAIARDPALTEIYAHERGR